MSHFQKVAAVEDYMVKGERLCIPFAIVANATPASKTNSNDLPAALTLALQGQTAAAAAIDSGTNFTTPVDASGIFGVLLSGLGTVSRLKRFGIDNPSSGTFTIALAGASSSGITANGNIALSVTWSGNLATTNLSACMTVDYATSKDSNSASGY